MAKATETSAPTILVLGSTGQTGRLIVEELDRNPSGIQVRVCSRKKEQVEKMRSEGRDAVYLDLDDPRTFPEALAGVNRLYLLTGYTVAMLVQSKTLTDAAKKAGVEHIVHQGVFSEWDVTDPHFAWHEMIERYIEVSGVGWTHLHPNYFMDNLLGVTPLRHGAFPWYVGDMQLGWIALKDVAAVAATVLREGPKQHGGQNYWMSAELLNGEEVAAILNEVLGQKICCEHTPPETIEQAAKESGAIESWYAASAAESLRQMVDGRMAYIGTVRDDVPRVTGRPSTKFRDWAMENRDRLLKAAS